MNLNQAIKKAKSMQSPTRVGGRVGQVVVIVESDGEYDAIPKAWLTDASYRGSRNAVREFSN